MPQIKNMFVTHAPKAMMNMAAMMGMAMGNAEEEEEKVAAPPPDPIDPRVKEICRHFGIDDKICEKLNKVGFSMLHMGPCIQVS